MREVVVLAASIRLDGSSGGLEVLYAVAVVAGVVAGLLGRRK